MGKSIHFSGQPVYGKLIDLLSKESVLRISAQKGGEKYVKRFDAWQHLLIMLYAVIKRLDSLREISVSMEPEVHKFAHLGLAMLPKRSTLSDANARRPESVFEGVYRDLCNRHIGEIMSDSRTRQNPHWLMRLHIIDSTTISLFSNLIFKGVGRHPKTGKKKGGVKAHTVIDAASGMPTDVKFTSAATHDSFMLVPSQYAQGDIVAMDRAYIDYEKFEELTRNGVVYVTKMKKSLRYDVSDDIAIMNANGVMEYKVQRVTFSKTTKDGGRVIHHARIITYVDTNNHRTKTISLLTNDMDMCWEDVIDIYRKRWEIETLFKQLKQNFPLRYFYGESANAIKIQIWVTLIANLLLTVIQKRIKNRTWSFSGLATIIRITLMYYIDCYSFLSAPEKDWEILHKRRNPKLQLSLFD